MKYTEKSAAAVISRLLKETRKESREALHYTWIDAAGRQCCCDGYRAYRLRVPVANVPDMPARLKGIDLDRVFPKAADLRPVELPSLEDVKALCAADRANADEPRRYQFAFGEDLPVVNLLYLRDMLQLYPDARCYVGGLYSPLLFVSEHGDGVLLPLRAVPNKQRSEEANAAMLRDFYKPRQIPGKTAAPVVSVFSAMQFAARFAQ